jgi:triacylglycerol lipase
MLARVLQAWLLVQAGAVAGAAGWLMASGRGFGRAVMLALAVLLAIHGGVFVVRLAVAWRQVAAQSGSPQVGWCRVFGGAVAEWLALLALYSVLMPFQSWWMGVEAPLSPPRGRPIVVLIHGYLCNRGFWWWLRRRLRQSGVVSATITLEPPFGDIEAFAEQLDRRLRVLPGADEVPLVLVGHSMGGLVARAHLRRYGSGRVEKLITLGSPHHGTRSARMGLGTDARQMEPDSRWLAELNATEQPPVPTLCLWSPHDAVVLPPSSGRLRGVAEVVLPALGHLSMGFSPRVLAVLEKEATSCATAAVRRA